MPALLAMHDAIDGKRGGGGGGEGGRGCHVITLRARRF